MNKQIEQNSRLIPIRNCNKITDGDQHYITFQTGNSSWREHSEVKTHKGSIPGTKIEDAYRKSSDKWETINLSFTENLFEKNAKLIREQINKEEQRDRTILKERTDRSVLNLLDVPPEAQTKTGYLLHAANLLSVFYGLTLVIVGER